MHELKSLKRYNDNNCAHMCQMSLHTELPEIYKPTTQIDFYYMPQNHSSITIKRNFA